MTLIIFVLFFIGVTALIALGLYFKRKREEAMAAYALSQGWQALPADGITLQMDLPEALAGKGDNHSFDMAYSLKVGAQPGVIFQYQYETHTETYNSATNMPETQTQTYSFAVLTFTLPQAFLPLYVQRHTFLGGLGGYEHQQKLEVEGDFNKHFEIYTPQGTQVEALSLLTPDIMALMEDSGLDFSVQVMGTKISVFGDNNFISPENAPKLIGYATELAAKLAAKPSIAPTQTPSV